MVVTDFFFPSHLHVFEKRIFVHILYISILCKKSQIFIVSLFVIPCALHILGARTQTPPPGPLPRLKLMSPSAVTYSIRDWTEKNGMGGWGVDDGVEGHVVGMVWRSDVQHRMKPVTSVPTHQHTHACTHSNTWHSQEHAPKPKKPKCF